MTRRVLKWLEEFFLLPAEPINLAEYSARFGTETIAKAPAIENGEGVVTTAVVSEMAAVTGGFLIALQNNRLVLLLPAGRQLPPLTEEANIKVFDGYYAFE